MSPPLTLYSILAETRRIISAHSRHFLGLAVLFLLPLSFLTTIYSTLQNLLLSPSHSYPHHQSQALLRRNHLHHHHHFHQSTSTTATTTLLFPIIYTLFAFFLSLCAAGSISFSVIHGFFGRPVKLVNALYSLLHTFLPLLFTLLSAQLIQFFLCSIAALVLFLVVKSVEFVGFGIDYSSIYFLGLCGVVGVALLLGLFYLQVNWALAFVVVVVESSWGFEPLRRSAKLVKGMRRLVLTNLLFFGTVMGLLVWLSATGKEQDYGEFVGGWKSWIFVIRIVGITTLLMLFMFNSLAAHSVLYLYCKAVNGELAGEIADEFAWAYVSLPFDDGKVSHVVSVATV